MANRDYPLAPTFKPGPGNPKRSRLKFDRSPVKKDSMPKKTAVKKELTPEEIAVISRSQKNQSVLGGFRNKGIVEKAKLSRDSSNDIIRYSSGPAKKMCNE